MIYLMRHFKVKDTTRSWMNSSEFEQWVKDYDTFDLAYTQIDFPKVETIYVSSQIRALKTADFIVCAYQVSDLVREVDAKAWIKTSVCLPKWFWLLVSRIQWYFNMSKGENRMYTIFRVHQFFDTCDLTKDICIITHGFVMKTIIKELKSLGFRGYYALRPRNGTLYVFSNLAIME